MILTSGRGGGPSSNILLKIGIKKAAVFPEPEKVTTANEEMTTILNCKFNK